MCLTSFFFFFNDTATTEIYTLSLHDALPIFAEGSLELPGGTEHYRVTHNGDRVFDSTGGRISGGGRLGLGNARVLGMYRLHGEGGGGRWRVGQTPGPPADPPKRGAPPPRPPPPGAPPAPARPPPPPPTP